MPIKTLLALQNDIDLPLQLYENEDEVLKHVQKMLELKRVKEKYKNKIKSRGDGRQYYVRLSRDKMITSTTEKGLYEKLWQLEYGPQMRSLNDLFSEYLIWKRDYTAVTSKTIKETQYVFQALIKDSDLASKPICYIKTTDIVMYFREITKGRTLTKKRFMSAKSILSGMFSYATQSGIINTNPLLGVGPINQFPFKPVNRSNKAFSIEERRMIMEHLSKSDNIYDLAIQLDFCMVLRIGELLALKWSDIEGSQIHIQRSLTLTNKVNDDLTYNSREIIPVDHIKGNADDGFRYEPITNSAAIILNRIKDLGIDSEYIFSSGGKFLLTDTFNERLKKVCNELNIPYRSSHKIRFTTASMLYEGNVSSIDIQRMLGHTTQAMTMHYLRKVTANDNVISKMNEIL